MRRRQRPAAPHSCVLSLALSCVTYLSLDFQEADGGLGAVGGLQQRDQTEQDASTSPYLWRETRGATDAHTRRQ